MAFNLTGCAWRVQAVDLMDGIKGNSVSGKASDAAFTDSQLRFYVDMFKSSASNDGNENILISPLSVELALAMTANGAGGQTKDELEALLGGDISIETLNKYLYSYVHSLPSEDKYKLKIANSIWLCDSDRLNVKKDFLQTNADYYGADVYKSSFGEETVREVNEWVNEHTDGMIDEIIDNIGPDTVMYLVNALTFDAEWDSVYDKEDIYDGEFTSASGEKHIVEMMYSEESKYFEDANAVGFIKDYKDGKYSFAALLPIEDVGIGEYISSLTGEGLGNILKSVKNENVKVTMPKFRCEYELPMNDILCGLGIPLAFDPVAADFSNMAESPDENICIGDVLHKKFISVDELGTKAGAASKVEMRVRSSINSDFMVTLDRPFIYMIIDNSANLPVFMGTVTDIQK